MARTALPSRTAAEARRAAAAAETRRDRLNRQSEGKTGAALARNLRNRALAANERDRLAQKANQLDKKAGRKSPIAGARGKAGAGSKDG